MDFRLKVPTSVAVTCQLLVSILVLMDFRLKVPGSLQRRQSGLVSILVLMDFRLKEAGCIGDVAAISAFQSLF